MQKIKEKKFFENIEENILHPKFRRINEFGTIEVEDYYCIKFECEQCHFSSKNNLGNSICKLHDSDKQYVDERIKQINKNLKKELLTYKAKLLSEKL